MRIAAVADLHGHLPTIPPCDLLLIAGDICPDYYKGKRAQREWFVERFVPWLEQQPVADATYATWGNLDWLPEHTGVGWKNFPEAHFVKVDTLVEHYSQWATLRIWFSPWSNQFGHWAWMADPEAIGAQYALIPDNVDIIVSHQPPYGYGDSPDPRFFIGGEKTPPHVGSKELLAALTRVAPDLLFCGHIHGGYGTYKHLRTRIYNVSLVDEAYRPVNPVTMVTLIDPL